MPAAIKNLVLSCFPRQLTRQVRELYLSSIILLFAESMVMIFEPVFLYLIFSQLFDFTHSLQLVLIFYLIIYILYFFALPLGARFAKYFGYENSIAWGVFFTAALYGSLFLMNKYLWPAAALTIIFYVCSKLFYWPAYHADFARFSEAGQRGRAIGNLAVLETIACVIGPLLGGLILQFSNFFWLFSIAAGLMILSNIPMLITKEKFTPSTFGYFKAYQTLFSRERRRKFFALWGFGEELIVMVIWPIFIFIVVKDFLGLGSLTSLSLLITALAFIFIGRLTDRHDGHKILKYGAIFYFFGWLLRLLSRSIFGVFMVDAYSRFSKQSISVPVVAMTYSRATSKDASVMSTIVFFEMSLVVGKIVAMLLALLLLQLFAPGWNALFILAALFTLLYLLF